MNKQGQAPNNSMLILEVCAIDLSDLKAKKRISPIGKVTGIDGRVFNIDGAERLKQLKQNGLELSLSVSHGWTQKYGDESVGWFSDYELRDDGIYASLEFTEDGNDLVASKKYKYLSPEYFVDYDTNEVVMVVGVGLVNKPNLLNESLNHQNIKKDEDMSTTVEDENKDLKAQNKVLADKITALEEQNALHDTQLRTQKIDNAIVAKELMPAKKDFALTLEGNALDTFLDIEKGSAKPAENNHLKPEGQENNSIEGGEVFEQLGLNGEK